MNPKDLTFDFLYKASPPTVKGYIERLNTIPQSYNWHPEGNVEIHTRVVLNMAILFNDVDIILAALFHDLGKVDTTKPNGKGGFSAHDHEKVSGGLVKYSKRWIKSLGGNPDTVEWIVLNHMRYKHIKEMSVKKQLELSSHPDFFKLCLFGECDSRENVDISSVIGAKGNPFKYLFNKIRTYFKDNI